MINKLTSWNHINMTVLNTHLACSPPSPPVMLNSVNELHKRRGLNGATKFLVRVLSLLDNGGPATSESTQSWANKLPKFPVVDSPLSVHFSNDAKNLP